MRGSEHCTLVRQVLMRELPAPLVQRPEGWPAAHPSVPNATAETFEPRAGADYPLNPLVQIDAGAAALGKPRSWPSFGWDNEYGEATRQARMSQKQVAAQKDAVARRCERLRAGGLTAHTRKHARAHAHTCLGRSPHSARALSK